jgi:alpha-methylacyl-CoA racemase
MSRLNGFLAGIRVIDLSRHLPGPLLTLFLADMGAEVIKIEPPRGDEMRAIGPVDASGRPIYFETLNAGKVVRRIDLKTPTGTAELRRLVESADVLVESFRPGVMARLGVDYAALRPINSRLIYCALNGYGSRGPLAAVAGHDINYLAAAGALHVNARAGQPFFDPPVADCSATLLAGMTILGALHARARDGRGCEIELALADAIMPLQALHLAELGATGSVPQPGDSYLNGGAAYYQVYDTADGRRISLGALEAKFWAAFCAAAHRPEWVARQQDPLPQRELTREVASMFASLTLAECLDRFSPADCCFAPVADLGEAIASSHHQQRGVVRRGADGRLEALFPAIVDQERPTPRAPLRDETACT